MTINSEMTPREQYKRCCQLYRLQFWHVSIWNKPACLFLEQEIDKYPYRIFDAARSHSLKWIFRNGLPDPYRITATMKESGKTRWFSEIKEEAEKLTIHWQNIETNGHSATVVNGAWYRLKLVTYPYPSGVWTIFEGETDDKIILTSRSRQSAREDFKLWLVESGKAYSHQVSGFHGEL